MLGGTLVHLCAWLYRERRRKPAAGGSGQPSSCGASNTLYLIMMESMEGNAAILDPSTQGACTLKQAGAVPACVSRPGNHAEGGVAIYLCPASSRLEEGHEEACTAVPTTTSCCSTAQSWAVLGAHASSLCLLAGVCLRPVVLTPTLLPPPAHSRMPHNRPGRQRGTNGGASRVAVRRRNAAGVQVTRRCVRNMA